MLSVRLDGGIAKQPLSLAKMKNEILDSIMVGVEMCTDIMRSGEDVRVKISAMNAVISAGRYVNETQRITPDDNRLDISSFSLLGDGENGKS